MSTPLFNLPSTVECPQCSKQAIVSPQNGIYQCLNCDFERSLIPAEPTSETQAGLGEFVFAIAGFLVTIALIL